MNKSERRKLKRFPLELPAFLSVIDESDQSEPIELVTRNICSGGAFFKTEKPLPASTNLKIDLIIPLDKLKNIKGKKSYVEVLGSVVRTNEQGMAVRFDRKYNIYPL